MGTRGFQDLQEELFVVNSFTVHHTWRWGRCEVGTEGEGRVMDRQGSQ